MAETVSPNSERDAYQQFLDDFQETIQNASLRLLEITDEDAGKRTEEAWTSKEILGHLIDSAANNHQRFVRAQFTDDLAFPGYEQNEWVSSQKYTDESWPELIQLWSAYNFHLLHVASVIPEPILTKPRANHT